MMSGIRAFCSPPGALPVASRCHLAGPSRSCGRRRPKRTHVCTRMASTGPRSSPIVCCGKFDAFHVGHLELAKRASENGSPVLLSFSGMAEALGWPPRAPVVAPVERAAILRNWGVTVGRQVGYRVLPFEDVRKMEPEEFVSMLRNDLGFGGIVCGTDWRFGHKAKGDVSLLKEIADKMDNFSVVVVDPITLHGEGQPEELVVVSSTAVRKAIASGNVSAAAEMMKRPHRLVGFLEDISSDSVAVEDAINQIPGDGTYQALIRVPGQSEPVRSFVEIERPGGENPLLHGPDVDVRIVDANSLYCLGCEVYIDFEERVS